MKNIKVRFAPSPTGQLHLGGARTALFNYLFANHHNGMFFLRIEDTDRDRSKKEYIDQILDSMTWMGLSWDGDPILQSQRSKFYQEATNQLMQTDSVYRCFCSRDMLEKSRAAGAFQYPGTCRDLSETDISKHLNSGEDFVLRLKVPEGATSFADLIYGNVNVDHSEIDDFILVRSDGTPTYNFTAVVDDNYLDITHVIRGDDHLSNTPKQILIYQSLGMQIPVFAPMILGPDKKRLSKRHSAPGVQEFKDHGYLPDSLLNGLLLLGWNPGTDQEIFTLEEMVNEFELSMVNKKSAVYDQEKLSWISGQHMKRLGAAQILEGIHALDSTWGQGKETGYLYSILEQLKNRSKSLTDFMDQSNYYFSVPDTYDEKSVTKNWKDNKTNERIKIYVDKLDSLSEWNSETIESTLRNVAETLDLSAGKLIHPTRLALSGVPSGPSLFAMMEILGQEVCIERMKRALERLPKND